MIRLPKGVKCNSGVLYPSYAITDKQVLLCKVCESFVCPEQGAAERVARDLQYSVKEVGYGRKHYRPTGR